MRKNTETLLNKTNKRIFHSICISKQNFGCYLRVSGNLEVGIFHPSLHDRYYIPTIVNVGIKSNQ